MRRLPPLELLIIAIVVVMLVLGWRIYGTGEMGRFAPVVRAQHAPSALYARLTIRYSKPPIYQESYDMQDVEGVSSFSYRVRSYNCREILVKAPPRRIYDVSFFFGKLDQDGVWQLMNQAPRPHPDAYYTVFVKQLADFKQGQRTVTFTNPHFWATTNGQQYAIDLSKQKPTALLHMQSTSLANPAYQTIVDDFRDFGPPEFKSNVAAAHARAVGSRCT